MTCDYSDEYILDLINIQLRCFKITEDEFIEIKNIFPEVKSRLQINFSHSENKYYKMEVKFFLTLIMPDNGAFFYTI